MEGPPKETVIIVHGTWAAPNPAKRRWYEPVDDRPGDEPFTAKLDAALQERGSAARCWAHCTDGNPIFQWSGKNSWIDRTHAAVALVDYVAMLRKEGWRCHIVAHSHGGNVVVEALPQIAAPSPSQPLGTIVTLGSPFMDTMSPILRRIRRWSRILNVISWILIASFAAVLGFFAAGLDGIDSYFFASFAVLLLVALPVGEWIDRRRRTTAQGQPPLLFAMGSAKDEAWQILYHMRSMQNPLAVKSNLLSYLFTSLRSDVSRAAQVARIHGAKSYRDLGIIVKLVMATTYALILLFFVFLFIENYILQQLFNSGVTTITGALYFLPFGVLTPVLVFVLFLTKFLGEGFYSAFWSPFRWCARQVGSLRGIFPEIATYVVRNRGWSVLQATVTGLEGFRFTLPLVEQSPRNVKYENMPKGAELRAMKRRSDWVARHLADVSETFAKLVVTAADLTALQRMIEVDQELVHAAYYTDDECIARIADWIAGDRTAHAAPESFGVR
jgi:hypothetical protein